MVRVRPVVLVALFIGSSLAVIPAPASALVARGPIMIVGDADLLAQAAAEGWTGTGSIGDPIVVSGYDISGARLATLLYVKDTTLHLNITGNRVHGDVQRCILIDAGLTANVVVDGNDVAECRVDGIEARARGTRIVGNQVDMPDDICVSATEPDIVILRNALDCAVGIFCTGFCTAADNDVTATEIGIFGARAIGNRVAGPGPTAGTGIQNSDPSDNVIVDFHVGILYSGGVSGNHIRKTTIGIEGRQASMSIIGNQITESATCVKAATDALAGAWLTTQDNRYGCSVAIDPTAGIWHVTSRGDHFDGGEVLRGGFGNDALSARFRDGSMTEVQFGQLPPQWELVNETLVRVQAYGDAVSTATFSRNHLINSVVELRIGVGLDATDNLVEGGALVLEGGPTMFARNSAFDGGRLVARNHQGAADIRNNTVIGALGVGLTVTSTGVATVVDNVVSSVDDFALFVNSPGGGRVARNSLTGGGMRLEGNRVIAESNTLNDVRGTGLAIGGTAATVRFHSIAGAATGLVIYGSGANVYDNVVANGGTGLRLDGHVAFEAIGEDQRCIEGLTNSGFRPPPPQPDSGDPFRWLLGIPVYVGGCVPPPPVTAPGAAQNLLQRNWFVGNDIGVDATLGSMVVPTRIWNNVFDNAQNVAPNGFGGAVQWSLAQPQRGTNIVGGRNLGGNFWSDYVGADANRDGLGDSPYLGVVLPDLYPLLR